MTDSLPHAYPFRFVDSVLEKADFTNPAPPGRVRTQVSVGGRACAQGEWASPLLMAEAVAQAALLLEGGDRETAKRGFFAGMDGFEVSRPPRAGETLTIAVSL